MVLGVVNLHRARVDVRLESAVVIIESGKFECHFVFSLMGMECSDSGGQNQTTGAAAPKIIKIRLARMEGDERDLAGKLYIFAQT